MGETPRRPDPEPPAGPNPEPPAGPNPEPSARPDPEPPARPDLQPPERLRRPPGEQAPATVAQVRGLRRWVVVAGVWAVAATALAVFALIEASKEDEQGREQAAGELGRVQRQLDNRIDGLEQRVDDLPTSEDVADLDARLGQVENDSGQASRQLERLADRVDGLEGQVADLEEASRSQTETDTTTTGADETP